MKTVKTNPISILNDIRDRVEKLRKTISDQIRDKKDPAGDVYNIDAISIVDSELKNLSFIITREAICIGEKLFEESNKKTPRPKSLDEKESPLISAEQAKEMADQAAPAEVSKHLSEINKKIIKAANAGEKFLCLSSWFKISPGVRGLVGSELEKNGFHVYAPLIFGSSVARVSWNTPECFRSNPSYQSQAENDCTTCKFQRMCFMENKGENNE